MKKKKEIPAHKFHIKRGDKVLVIAGNSKGVEGEVLHVIIDKDRAVVAGANIMTKHIKPSAKKPEGGRIQTEAPIHISNLMLIDPKTGKPTRIGRKLVEVEGRMKIFRYSKESGEIIK